MDEDGKEALAKFRGYLISANKIADEQKWGNVDLVNLQSINLGFNIVRIIDVILDMASNIFLLEELADKLEDKSI